ncbi:hypothetical protein J3459_022274 [Metarhizium acridum]|nr:hypothetical protein J3459_022274 [Metarhizium acridum]
MGRLPVRPRFPFSAYLASYVAVLLYFLAGMLPDPQGPWNPTAAHCSAWITGALMEVVVASRPIFCTDIFGCVQDLCRCIECSRGVQSRSLCPNGGSSHLQRISAETIRAEISARGTPVPTGEWQRIVRQLCHGPVFQARVRCDQNATDGRHELAHLRASFRVLFPYLWPRDSVLYQAVVVVCICLLICQRIVNVLAPLQLGNLVDALGRGGIPYKDIILFVAYRYLQGNQGAIGALRSVLWIPVSQSLFRRLSNRGI